MMMRMVLVAFSPMMVAATVLAGPVDKAKQAVDPDCTLVKAAKGAVQRSTIGVGNRCKPGETARDTLGIDNRPKNRDHDGNESLPNRND